jgi:hypothetical protein
MIARLGQRNRRRTTVTCDKPLPLEDSLATSNFSSSTVVILPIRYTRLILILVLLPSRCLFLVCSVVHLGPFELSRDFRSRISIALVSCLIMVSLINNTIERRYNSN